MFELAVGRLLVFVQVRFQSESFVTLGAAETLGRRVGLQVGAKVGTISEGLTAPVTSVRLFTCV